MNLENVTAVIRPRGPWESVDMGFRMVLTRARLIYATLALFMLPVYAVIVGISFMAGAVEISMLIFWWLKPALDRIVLHILSRSLFGDPPGVRSTLRQAVRLACGAGIVQALTIYRFDPARSLNLPVWQLEKLRGAQRWRRARVLHRETWGVATLLTLFCSSLEAVAMFGVYAVVGVLIPPELDMNLAGWADYFITGEGSTAFSLVHIVIYSSVICLVEPLFVGGGFALYLNRRTILEAWDIELAFRRLAARHRNATAAAAVIVGLSVSLALLTPHSLRAQTPEADTAVLIQEILNHADFDTYEPVSEWQPHYLQQDDNEQNGWRAPEGLARLVAKSGEFVIWAAVFALGAFLWLRRGLLQAFFQAPDKRQQRSATAQARQMQALQASALPDDIPAAVALLWQAQRYTDAVSLLYRGALNEVQTQHAIKLGSSATEGDWLRAVQRHSPGNISQFFQAITRTWQYTAYAHQAPSSEHLLALCRQWPEHFGRPA